MMNKEQCELLDLIRMLNFNLFDTALFLDTHPCNQQALKNYEKFRQLLKQAVKEYTQYFGPLTIDDVETQNEWTWGRDPWPWEREAN
ncbi:MAG: spore coat protein CotJB [Cellulosilyticum sp.]|nr:spore coat protein CotJB [Cellulosilyticum sp.]